MTELAADATFALLYILYLRTLSLNLDLFVVPVIPFASETHFESMICF